MITLINVDVNCIDGNNCIDDDDCVNNNYEFIHPNDQEIKLNDDAKNKNYNENDETENYSEGAEYSNENEFIAFQNRYYWI